MARQAKSGTSKQRKEKRVAPARTIPFINDQVRAKVADALKKTAQLSKYSSLSSETREELFVGLIQQHGVEACTALIEESHRLKDGSRADLLMCPALRALTRLRRLREAKQLLAHLSYSPMQRMWAYSVMGYAACPEDKELILTWMRTFAEGVRDPIQSFDVRFMICEVTLDDAEYERLTILFPERCAVPKIRQCDIQNIIGFATHSEGVQLMVQAVKILEERCSGAVATFGETELWMCLMGWERAQLERLAAELPTSRYVQEILRLAQEVRDPNEVLELEQEELATTSSRIVE